MKLHTRIYRFLRTRWRARRKLTNVERLEREYFEAQNLGFEIQESKHELRDTKSKYQHDMLHSDESSNVYID